MVSASLSCFFTGSKELKALCNYITEQLFNSLPTNDGKCRHDLCELSISLWEFIWGFNTRCYTLVHGFCFFKLFLMVGKELILKVELSKQIWSVLCE